MVKRIFDLCVAGKGPMQIAKILTADKVLTVKAYYAKRDGKTMPDNLYRWDDKSISWNFGTSRIYWLYGQLQNLFQIPQAEKAYCKIRRKISRIFPQYAVLQLLRKKYLRRVQGLRANKRRPTKTGRQGLFSGLLYCADCGEKLLFLHNEQLFSQSRNTIVVL